MSTRCQVGLYAEQEILEHNQFEEFTALIYRHSDGYPEGVIPVLVEFLEFWQNTRGLQDVEYMSARLLQYMTNGSDRDMLEYWKKEWVDKYEKNKDNLTGSLGFGLCKDFHGDIEFFYAISPIALSIYEVDYARDVKITDRFYFKGEIKLPISKHSIELADKWYDLCEPMTID